jgi:ketosteroid isomerase-like protein
VVGTGVHGVHSTQSVGDTVAEVESRVDVVQRYLDTFASADPDAVAAFVTDDFVNEHLSELGSGCTGRDEYSCRLPGFLSTFAGARYVVEAIGPLGDADVIVRYRFQAEYEGTSIDIPGIMWFEVRGDRIARRTDLWDSLTFLRQTGQAR